MNNNYTSEKIASSNIVFDIAADCHLHIASSLYAEPPLGDLVPLSGVEWLEWRRDPAQTSRRCQAQPIRRHGLQQPDICQNSEFFAAVNCRGSSGNAGAYKERLLEEANVNNAFEVADPGTFQLLTSTLPWGLAHHLNCFFSVRRFSRVI